MISLTPVILKQHFVQNYVISRNIYFKNKIVDRLIDPNVLQAILDNFKVVEKIVNKKNNKAFNETYDSISVEYINKADQTENFIPTLDFEIKMTLGFYSSSSVCLPDFYSESSLASKFSTVLLCFNFFIDPLFVLGTC